MNKKNLILALLIALFPFLIHAQVTEAEKVLREKSADTTLGWKTGGSLTLTMAQTSLTNWAAGGQNSVSFNGRLSLFASHKAEKSVWDNTLDIGYGLMKQGIDNYYTKTDDKIDLLSKYGREAFKNFYYSVLFSFRTQMSPGYKYPDLDNKISDFFAPAYILLAAGMDYRPNPYFSAFLAPLTAKFTIVNDPTLSEQGAFGVKPGEKSRSEIGGYIRAAYSRNDFKSDILKNVAFTTKIDLFSNYIDKPQNVDVNWETLIGLKINKFLVVNFNIQLVYDDNTMIPVDRNGDGVIQADEPPGPRTQFKEIFGVGFSFKF
jgi:hypothetical protein